MATLPSSELLSDLESESLRRASLETSASEFISTLHIVLDNARDAVSSSSAESLGKGLRSCCDGLADGVGEVAREIARKDDSQKREFARACLEDMRLGAESAKGISAGDDDDNDLNGDENVDVLSQYQKSYASITEDEMVANLNVASQVLLDVESSLRAFTDEEAEEIAEVSIAVAEIFLEMLKGLVESISPAELAQTLDGANTVKESTDFDIEDLDENGNPISTEEERRKERSRKAMRDKKRMRLLWPALGPKVFWAAKVRERRETRLLLNTFFVEGANNPNIQAI